jgi:hypothetical protein
MQHVECVAFSENVAEITLLKKGRQQCGSNSTSILKKKNFAEESKFSWLCYKGGHQMG